MHTKKVLLVKYGEISLRKGNRAHFEHGLLDAIRANLREINDGSIRVVREQGRFLVEDMRGDLDVAAVLPKIKNIFGIAGFCHAVKTEAREIETLCELGCAFFAERFGTAKTFRVETKRSDKNYPITSTEISARIGERIFNANLNLKVDLHKPEIILWVEIRNDVYWRRRLALRFVRQGRLVAVRRDRQSGGGLPNGPARRRNIRRLFPFAALYF
jgi:thiamine biosynthesis protein ThiI